MFNIQKILTHYSSVFTLLEQVDYNTLSLPSNLNTNEAVKITYEQAVQNIADLKLNLNEHALFGNQKDEGFKSALQSIYQSFDNVEIYPSLEQKAANLLYLIIKNHAFTDGNKRIGCLMFLTFLDVNNLLFNPKQEVSVSVPTIVAMALLIAQSQPEQKELMVNLVVNLIS